ncbi:MAG: HepT-like ribonuclease domain-containing protein [Phycisphaerae bacterium]|nr:HepT-like ribonuclease domain-containing protein [Phycisphaerae bacterium]
MTRHDTIVRLRHMLDHAQETVQMAHGCKRKDLDANRQLSLALTRLLEIVGEAAARVPAEERQRFSAIPWRDVVDLRNRLIHGYDEVNLDILWAIVQKDLPALAAELDKILASFDPGPSARE